MAQLFRQHGIKADTYHGIVWCSAQDSKRYAYAFYLGYGERVLRFTRETNETDRIVVSFK
jgi:hypothetical protein